MQKISRKQKSLGLLCDKFVQRFPESVPEGDKCEIHLDDLAKQMGTERRRIYDIVNVLESVQMMTKVSMPFLKVCVHAAFFFHNTNVRAAQVRGNFDNRWVVF